MELTKEQFEQTLELKFSAFEQNLDKKLSNFATKEDLKSFATKEDLKSFATKEDLKSFATKEDLKSFATKEDLQKTEERIIKKVIARIDESQEQLALITKSGFDEVMEKIGKIDVVKRVEKLEMQMGEIRTSLQLN